MKAAFSPHDATRAGGDTTLQMGMPGLDADAGENVSSTEDATLTRAGSFRRLYRAFVTARAVLGLAVLAALTLGDLLGVRSPADMLLLSLVYAAQAVTIALLPRFLEATSAPSSLTRTQWVSTLGFDLLAFLTIFLFNPAASMTYAAVMVLPMLMAGALTSRLTALASAAFVTLVLLGAASTLILQGADPTGTMTQAGLAGMGFFVIVLLASELADRLAREERAARGSLELARQQAQLNRLVIEEMADGVLVLDRRARVRAANPAARRMLVPQGVGPKVPFSLSSDPAWRQLSQAVGDAYADLRWPAEGRDLRLDFPDGSHRVLRLRLRFTGPRDGLVEGQSRTPEVFCVAFAEDMVTVHARTRQEKLAAMGRMSAGIAHEIRNPLAAIAQANALMLEDELDAPQRRLVQMVDSNVSRLKRIVDDVMEVAPGPPPDDVAIDVVAEIGAVASEWARTHELALGEGSRLRVELPREPLGAFFDPEHLRRLLINLLDNAARHASQEPGAVELRLRRHGERRLLVTVASDGEPIPPEVEQHLFEPFFSTRSRGTGLGLYICKELCDRYGASIDYRLRPPGVTNRNQFVVTLRATALDTREARLHL